MRASYLAIKSRGLERIRGLESNYYCKGTILVYVKTGNLSIERLVGNYFSVC